MGHQNGALLWTGTPSFCLIYFIFSPYLLLIFFPSFIFLSDCGLYPFDNLLAAGPKKKERKKEKRLRWEGYKKKKREREMTFLGTRDESNNVVTTTGVVPDIEQIDAGQAQSDSKFERRDGLRIVEEHEEKDLSRSLKQRHIQMIALAGAIVSTIIYLYLYLYASRIWSPFTNKSLTVFFLGHRAFPQSRRCAPNWRSPGSSAWLLSDRCSRLRRPVCTW